MDITSEDWQLLCQDVAQKEALLLWAEKCGVKVAPQLWGHHTDADLYLNFWNKQVGIGSLPVRHTPGRGTTLIGAELFTTMCQAYAEALPDKALLLTT